MKTPPRKVHGKTKLRANSDSLSPASETTHQSSNRRQLHPEPRSALALASSLEAYLGVVQFLIKEVARPRHKHIPPRVVIAYESTNLRRVVLVRIEEASSDSEDDVEEKRTVVARSFVPAPPSSARFFERGEEEREKRTGTSACPRKTVVRARSRTG